MQGQREGEWISEAELIAAPLPNNQALLSSRLLFFISWPSSASNPMSMWQFHSMRPLSP